MERGWRDVRKDTIEPFRRVFLYLEQCNLLDMEEPVHCLCLILVYQPRIQASLDCTKDAWNHHKVRTAGNRSPLALFELSQEKAIHAGYWTGDPGDTVEDAMDPRYGLDGEVGQSGLEEERYDMDGPNHEDLERDLETARRMLEDLDLMEEDNDWGITVYCRAVLLLASQVEK